LLRPVTTLPDFLIIGAQKGGTTSLADYLNAHRDVVPSQYKEVHFFDNDYGKGVDWYRSHFQVQVRHRIRKMLLGIRFVAGDATPYYLLHPLAASKCHALLPEARIIVMLRDPVDRAYSHYHHQVRHGHEFLSFEEALEAESSRLEGQLERFAADPLYRSFDHQHFSYLARGVYLPQIESWRTFYSPQQILVLSSEQFFAQPSVEYHRVLKFLGLQAQELREYPAQHVGSYQPMSAATRIRLIEYFAPHNHSLREYLNSTWPGVGDCVVSKWHHPKTLEQDKLARV
jgi:Sulfotransferase domain